MNKFQKGFVVPLLAVIVVLLIGAGVFYFTEKSPSSIYNNEQYGFSFDYSNTLTLENTQNGFSLSHSIPYKHLDFCNMKEATTLDSVTDFNLVGEIKNGKIEDVIKSDNFSDVTALQNKVSFGQLSGYLLSMGVEGCGVDEYYFSLKDNNTLILKNYWVGEFSESSAQKEKYLGLNGIISPQRSREFLSGILSSFNFTR